MDEQRESLNEIAMRSAEEELRRRRERGRQSQARFRKRQAQVSRTTRAENERMKAAIADIVAAAATPGADRPGAGLLDAIRTAADVAGVDGSALEGESGRDEAVVVRRDDAVVTTTLAFARGDDTMTTTPPRASENRSKSPVNRPRLRGGACRSSSASTSQSSGRLSPRLDYGIWVDSRRATRVSNPPHEIMPFLGAGRWTFAGQLYWACADYMLSLCHLVTSPDKPTPWFGDLSRSPNPREAEDRVSDMLQHCPPLRNVRLAQALAEAQCGYRDMGWIPGDSPAVTCGQQENIATLLRKEVEADYASRGHDLSAWMTIPELEGHMRRQLGAAAFERLERAAVAVATANSPTLKAAYNGGVVTVQDEEEVRAMTRLLIRNLAESYTCFGDGPRWKTESISMLFTEKMTIS
ncbi:hypothetical protein F4859DRAFT_2380 [Xylaria cf. heliscus]|nr:hypothetical protein F4859DRAFT_2380 [Xylaria cf. heliscus]